MGRFREFLIKEEIGLGDIGARIDKFVNDPWIGNALNGAFVSSDVSGSEQSPTLGYAGHDLHLPSTDLTIHSIQKQGRITTLLLKKNPIYIRLSDGTEAYFTFDEYKRIKGNPEIGKVMTIVFQRHPNDYSKQCSKIEQAIVTD